MTVSFHFVTIGFYEDDYFDLIIRGISCRCSTIVVFVSLVHLSVIIVIYFSCIAGINE